MDDAALWQQARLAEHAAVSTCQVEGHHYAWKPGPPGDEFAGEAAHGRDEDELRVRLAAG